MSSAVCRILPFPALCVPKQLAEDAWEVRRSNSDPSKRDSAKQRGAVNRKTECAAHSRGTYRRTIVLNCEPKVVYSSALRGARLPRRLLRRARR